MNPIRRLAATRRGARSRRLQRSTSARPGWTLVEMLVVISVIGALSVTGAVLVGLLMTADGRGADALVDQQVLSRLSTRFRADVHAATGTVIESGDEADATDGEQRLRLSTPGGSFVVYEFTDGRIERRVLEEETAAQRDSFRWEDGAARFETADDDRLIRLILERPRPSLNEFAAAELQQPASDHLVIEAALGWRRREP